MEEKLLKTKINNIVYSQVKKVLFNVDPEKTHNRFVRVGKFLGNTAPTKKLVSLCFNYQNPMLEQTILGIKFRNPVGLSAGFDKEADLISIMEDVGFGFTEVGSITAKPYEGNRGPRLKRYPEKKSIWVNYGLKNSGAKVISNKLKEKKFNIPVGINVAKTNCKETTDTKVGIADYIETLNMFNSLGIGDYFTLNISCPNAYGGQPFSIPRLYAALLKEVYKVKTKKPIFVKISPDLSRENIDKIIEISRKYKVDGFVVSNLTKEGNIGQTGGFSGKLVEEKSNYLLSYIYKKTKGEFILIGVGGIFTAEDAYKKIKLGANLVQLITGMIFRGPGLIAEINNGLVQLLKKDGYKNISEAVGKSA